MEDPEENLPPETDVASKPRCWGTISMWCGILAWMYMAGILALPMSERFWWLDGLLFWVKMSTVAVTPVLALTAAGAGAYALKLSGNDEFAVRERRRAIGGRALGRLILLVMALVLVFSALTMVFVV